MEKIMTNETLRVYEKDGDDYKFISDAIKSGVPIGRLDITMALAKILDKKPEEVNSAWMDAHVGIQQVLRDLPREVIGGFPREVIGG